MSYHGRLSEQSRRAQDCYDPEADEIGVILWMWAIIALAVVAGLVALLWWAVA